jgi:hypothetical protein
LKKIIEERDATIAQLKKDAAMADFAEYAWHQEMQGKGYRNLDDVPLRAAADSPHAESIRGEQQQRPTHNKELVSSRIHDGKLGAPSNSVIVQKPCPSVHRA